MRVAYQAGVIRALVESGLCFAHADGTSGGTINLAMLFSGLSPEQMCDRWQTLKVADFVSFMPLEQYLHASQLMGMGDADGIIDKVFPHLGIDISRINAAQGMDGTFNICNYSRKTNEVMPHRTIDLDLLVAGISLPMFMPPVRKGTDWYTDSVWIKDANLLEAVRRGADELWLVWCIGNSQQYKAGLFNQYVHMIEMSANGALFEEFTQISDINTRIAAGEVVYNHTRPITLHVIKPEYPLPLDPDLYLGRIDTATLIDMGYRDAKQYLSGMTAQGLPFQPETTHMKDANLGLTFRETMAGWFALGETDPKAGAEKGKAAGTHLTMNATIDIQDLKRFVSDPNHAGRITGHISTAALGDNLPAKGGTFNLFHPSGNPKLKWMVYELAFERDGQDYYLAGKKEVQDDPGFDLWTDTTSLLTQLHKGTDTTGPVIGAGILTLSLTGLLKLVSTVHATNATSTKESAEAILEFGRFFLGQLWDTYASKLSKP